jgi:hypothetical protein
MIGSLRKELFSTNDLERQEAFRELLDEPCDQDFLERAALSDPNPTVRYYAVQHRSIRLDVLERVIRTETLRSVTREAAKHLFRSADESPIAETSLVAALQNDELYELAFDSLDAFGNGKKNRNRTSLLLRLIPLLIETLGRSSNQGPNLYLLERAVTTLGSTGFHAAPALHAMRTLLEWATDDLRVELLRAIQRIESSVVKQAIR